MKHFMNSWSTGEPKGSFLVIYANILATPQILVMEFYQVFSQSDYL